MLSLWLEEKKSPFNADYATAQDRLTRDQLLFSRNLSPLQSCKVALQYLLLQPRSALAFVSAALTRKACVTKRHAHLLISIAQRTTSDADGGVWVFFA